MKSRWNAPERRSQSYQRWQGLSLTEGALWAGAGLLWGQREPPEAWATWGAPHVLLRAPLPCLALSGPPQQMAPRMLPKTHVSCWHGPHCCRRWPAPAVACLAASPSGPFAGLEAVPSGLFSCEGNWGRKARCGWNGSLWAQNKREGRQSYRKLAFLLSILQLQRAEATGKDQKTWDSWTGPLGLTEFQFWTNSAVAGREDLWAYSWNSFRRNRTPVSPFLLVQSSNNYIWFMTHGPGERPSAGHRFSPKCQVSALIVNGETICVSIKAIFTNNQGLCELLLIREASY